MRPILPALAAALLLFAGEASAEGGDNGPDYDPGHAKRRSDFAMGISTAGTVGTVGGYPNDVAKTGLSKYHASTGAAGGIANTFWLGGALRDWLVIGIGLSGSTVAGSETLSTGGVYVLHVEGFPLFYRGGAFRDVSLVGDFGVGSRTIKKASAEVASGGSTSFIALGLLYEPIRVGNHISAGPLLQVTEQFSDTLGSTLVMLGFQIAYYGGPT
jgi:hypothetical protein